MTYLKNPHHGKANSARTYDGSIKNRGLDLSIFYTSSSILSFIIHSKDRPLTSF